MAMNIDQSEKFIPILFGVLGAFIVLNLAVSLLLNFYYKKSLYSKLTFYWMSVLLVFLIQGLVQEGELSIIIAAMTSYLPLTILSQFVYDQGNEKFPLRLCLIGYTLSLPIVYILSKLGLNFTQVALAGSAAASIPMFLALKLLIFKWKDFSAAQRFLILPCGAFIIHIANFALFRLDPQAQFWGWSTSFAIYQTLGILLPAITLEHFNKTETSRLKQMVDYKTENLIKANKELNIEIKRNENLLRLVLHDIMNPLTILLGRLSLAREDYLLNKSPLEDIKRAELAGIFIKDIIDDVRQDERQQNDRHLNRAKNTKIIDCIHRIKEVYSPLLKKKELQFEIESQLNDSSQYIQANKRVLTNNVFSNLISNAIKFSHQKGLIKVMLYKIDSKVAIDIRDYGIGLDKDYEKSFKADLGGKSQVGTFGEVGSGQGLFLANKHLKQYGGQLILNPESFDGEGTLVRVEFEQISDGQSLTH